MTGIRSFFLALVLLLIPMSAYAAGWSLTFDEEFHGATLDRSAWATRLIYQGETLDHLNDEAQRYRDADNHVLNNDALDLVARKTATGWESGMIRSRQTFYFGYFEARVRLPHGRGIWPAFWLNSDYNIDGQLSWPPEIDVFEYPVNEKQDTANMFHSAASTYPKGADIQYDYTDPTYSKALKDYIGPAALNEGWHVFGLLWLPDGYSVFLDGKKIYTRAFRWVNTKGQMAPPAHIILNFAVGGQWPGRYGIDAAQFPQAFSIDYVRVCQYLHTPVGHPGCPHGGSTPDLGGTRYDYSPDMKKPIVSGSVVEPAQPTAGRDMPTAFRLKTKISDLSSLPSARPLLVTLQASGGGSSRPVATFDMPASTLLSDPPQDFSVAFPVPGDLPPGGYDVLVSVGAPAIDGKQASTPLTCGGERPVPKAASCFAGKINVAGPAGNPR
jgi:beta-glucanase (GH16 family)